MNGTGHPIRVPVIDLAEVCAGGGSIAWVDPQARCAWARERRRRSRPGCYGHGGTGRPSPTATCCSAISTPARCSTASSPSTLRRPKPRCARGSPSRSASTSATAAAAVIDVVNNAMAEVLKIVSVQRGHDPRDFVLAAFGGAGPLHAAALADELGISEVICPPIPGAFSALGLIGTDLRRDYVQTLFTLADATHSASEDAREHAFSSEASGQRGNFISARATDPTTLEAALSRSSARGQPARPRRHRRRRAALRALVDARYRAAIL